VVAFSGFDYHASERAISLLPKTPAADFVSFFSTGLGWGSFSIRNSAGATRTELSLTEGSLPLRSIRLGHAIREKSSVSLDGRPCAHHRDGSRVVLEEELVVPAGAKLVAQT